MNRKSDLDDFLEEEMDDPEFRALVDEIAPLVHFGFAVAIAREQRRMSIKALAEATGITRSALIQMEKGTVAPTLINQTKIARALDARLEISPSGKIDFLLFPKSVTKRAVSRHDEIKLEDRVGGEGTTNTEDLFTSKLPFIRALPANISLQKEHLCVPNLLLRSERNIEIYYAPFDYLNVAARIVIVGITPGWQQMAISYEELRDALLEGASISEAQMRADVTAAFAGPMRTNLISMLDAIGVAKSLELESTRLLFDEYQSLAHTTSVLRYPVFVDGQNYTGHSPPIFQQSVLEEYWRCAFPEEIRNIQGMPLLVPLGEIVTQVLSLLIDENVLRKEQCLLGFPHPSGQNGHRNRLFNERKHELRKTVDNWSTLEP